nr:MAG TPA: hypothetical protein [Caudoviricetes sp.]
MLVKCWDNPSFTIIKMLCIKCHILLFSYILYKWRRIRTVSKYCVCRTVLT